MRELVRSSLSCVVWVAAFVIDIRTLCGRIALCDLVDSLSSTILVVRVAVEIPRNADLTDRILLRIHSAEPADSQSVAWPIEPGSLKPTKIGVNNWHD